MADDAVRRGRPRPARARARRTADRLRRCRPDPRRTAALVVRRQGRPGRGRRRGGGRARGLAGGACGRGPAPRLDVRGRHPDRRRVRRARLRAGPALLSDGDRSPRRAAPSRSGRRRSPSDGATADDQRSVYDAVVEVWQDTNDPIDETFEEWAHWHVERDSYDPVALVPRHGRRGAGGVLDLPQRPGRPAGGLRQPAGRAAGLAAPGSRRGAPAPLVRCVPRAWA